MKSSYQFKAVLGFALAGWCLASLTASAQTWTGGGTDDKWSTAGNWSPAVPANNGSADVLFSGGLRLSPMVDSSWEVRSIAFDVSALGFTISGLPLGIGPLGLVNDSSQTQTLNNAVTLRAPQVWRAAGGPLVLGGAVATEGHALTIRGAQVTSLTGPVSGSGSITKRDGGTLRLLGMNSYSGGLVLSDGVLVLGNDAALGSGPLYPLAGRVRAEGGSRMLPNALVAGPEAIPRFDSSFDITFAGNALLDGNRLWWVENSGVITLAGTVAQTPSETSLTKLGAGVLALRGATANTLVGLVNVLEGELRLGKTARANAVAGNLVIWGPTSIATVRLEANDQIADTASVSVNNLGRLHLNGFSDTIQELQINGGAVTTDGGVLTLRGGISSLGGEMTGQIDGQLNLSGVVQTISLFKGSAPVDLRIGASISNGGVLKSGSGVLVLAGSNSFAQGFTLSGGILGVANDQAAGTGPLRLGGTIRAEEAARTLANVVQLGSFYGIAEPTFAGSHDLTFSGPVLLGGTPVWTVENTGRTIFAGPIGEPEPGGGLTKVGPGLVIFTGGAPNTYTGLTGVREGVLLLSKTAGVNAIAGPLDIGGASVASVVRLGANEQIADASRVFIRKAGLLDLNGFVETGTLELAGGRVETGTGRFVLASDLRTVVSDVTSAINGTLDLGGMGRTFNVVDGPQDVDLLITAAIHNGTIYKVASGRLLLTSSNGFSGGFALLSGSVGVGDDAALGQGPLHLVSSAASLSAESGTRTLSNPVFLQGNITMAGSNDLVFTGALTLLGKATLITHNPTVAAGSIGESGGSQRLVKKGPGTLVLIGANTFNGGLLVEEGLVELRQAHAPGNGLLVVNGGGVVLGDIAETVQAGPTHFSNNALIVARLDGPRSNALLRVNGDLALGGRVDVEARPGFGPGVYRLIEYTGAFGLGILSLGNVPPGFSYRLVTTTVGRVDLVVEAGTLEVNCPAGTVVSCPGEIPPPNLNALQVVRAGCGSVERSFKGDSYATNGTVVTITRTYEARDACGNVATCTQVITVSQGNEPAPVLTIRQQGSQVVLCWMHSCASDYVLEEATDLTAPVQWLASAATVMVSDDQRCATVQALGNKFFRLRAP